MRMKTVTRILAVTGCIALSSLSLAASASSDDLQHWIAEWAITVRFIAATDEDFSDLEPLIDAIGASRVVQLGEPSHGAGSSFAAKVRLIKFLHQRMGFDVVAWEAGLYDLQLTQAGMRIGEDAVTAARRGIFATWSSAEQAKPLFEYAKASQATTRPLEMAGFDMQISAVQFTDAFVAELQSFVGELRDPSLRKQATALAEQAIAAHRRIYARSEAFRRIEADVLKAVPPGGKLGPAMAEARAAWEKTEAAKLVPTKEDLDRLDRAATELIALIRSHRADFEQVHGARQVTFMEQVTANLRGNDMNAYDNQRPDRPSGPAASALYNEGWNRRDALNASNLRWLVESGYPGRKIIVWAHNVHVMNAYYAADLQSIHIEQRPASLKPSGVILAEWLQNDVYTIAMTGYEGSDGWDSAKPIAPAAEGTLEGRLHKLAKPYVFLDLRTLDDNPEHPLRKPQSLRIDKYRDDTLTDVTRAFDAIFFIDRMEPVTRIR